MALQPVDWVLVIYYGRSAHRATYGRLNDTKYTKDYIQLSRKPDFLEIVSRLFPVTDGADSVTLKYQWPTGTTKGALVFKSADRPHLKWETNLGAPKAWKMSLTPSETTAETIPGNPSHLDSDAAENELRLLPSRGAGQPYLIAVKLRDEQNTLHLRAYLREPSSRFRWADLKLAPAEIQTLAAKTSQESALAWTTINSSGRPLFFDPTKNHDAWLPPKPFPKPVESSNVEPVGALDVRALLKSSDDAAAETLEADFDEIEAFREQIERRDFEVPDSLATVKTRGSAQRAFAGKVKSNYGFRCAITGIKTKDFLVAAHIVPWSEDQKIRLDPTNGICLSLIFDRAFEKGYLLIEDDLSIRINWDKIGTDDALRKHLQPYDGQKLRAPRKGPPQPGYLQRRRAMV